MMRLFFDRQIVGYQLAPLITHTPIVCPHIVPLTIVFRTHHISTYQILTHSVSTTDLVSCVGNVKLVLVLYLVHLNVNTALMFIC